MSDMNVVEGSAGGMGGAGAAGIGGAIGAFVGAWAGDRGRRDGVDSAGGAGFTVLQDSVTAVGAGVTNLGFQTLQGQNATNMNVVNAASASYTGLTAQNTQNLSASIQGFAGLNTAILQGTNATVAAVGAADRGALERSFQAQLAAERCCCETNLNIERQANETRGLMRQQFADAQAVLICDLKSQVQTRDFLISQAAQTAKLRCEINQVEQLVNFKLPTPPTPPTGCCG